MHTRRSLTDLGALDLMSSTIPAGAGPEPALSLARLSLSCQISGGGGSGHGGGGGGGDAPGASELPLPVVGARVRCEGLTAAAELNSCLGRVVSHEGARAKVRMDGPGGRLVGVKPQNLVVVVGLFDLLALPDVFRAEVLRRLDPTALALLRRVDHACRAAVESSSDLPRAGVSDEVPLKVSRFVRSVALLAWAKDHGCPWTEKTLSLTAEGGRLEVMRWAREHACPWDESTCAIAAAFGRLDVLKWARQQHCPWDATTCAFAAMYGQLEVLKWARQHGCPWDERTCRRAALRGQLEVLKWARQHHCPWTEKTCAAPLRPGSWRC